MDEKGIHAKQKKWGQKERGNGWIGEKRRKCREISKSILGPTPSLLPSTSPVLLILHFVTFHFLFFTFPCHGSLLSVNPFDSQETLPACIPSICYPGIYWAGKIMMLAVSTMECKNGLLFRTSLKTEREKKAKTKWKKEKKKIILQGYGSSTCILLDR